MHGGSQISLLLSAFPCPCKSMALEEGSPVPWSEQPVSCPKAQVAATLVRLFRGTKYLSVYTEPPSACSHSPRHVSFQVLFLATLSPSAQPPLPSDHVLVGSSSLSEWAALYFKPAFVFTALRLCGALFGGVIVFPVDHALSPCQFGLCLLTAWFS